MQYISGIWALNLPCETETTGDWHSTSLNWQQIPLNDSEQSIFKDYGIRRNVKLPPYCERKEAFNQANHIRACLDLIEQGQYAVAQGMKEDFICNEKYTPEIFQKILLLQSSPDWEDIYDFIYREYGKAWRLFNEKITGKKALSSSKSPTTLYSRTENITAENIEQIVIKKCADYQRKYDLTALKDLIDIVLNHYELLNSQLRFMISNTLIYQGIESYDYLIHTHNDPCFNEEVLKAELISAMEKLELRFDKKF